jgi:hypothetical protein
MPLTGSARPAADMHPPNHAADGLRPTMPLSGCPHSVLHLLDLEPGTVWIDPRGQG